MFKVIAAAARITFASFALLCCAWLAPSQAQTTEPKLEYLMTYKALLEPAYKIDDTLYIINVLPGGWAKGPTINGTFIPPGGDKYTHEDVPYFVTAPTIQTASKKFGYLNRVQLINKFVEGRMSKEEGYVMYDVFVVR